MQIEVYDELIVIRRIRSSADFDEANWRENENVIDQLRRRVGSGYEERACIRFEHARENAFVVTRSSQGFVKVGRVREYG